MSSSFKKDNNNNNNIIIIIIIIIIVDSYSKLFLPFTPLEFVSVLGSTALLKLEITVAFFGFVVGSLRVNDENS